MRTCWAAYLSFVFIYGLSFTLLKATNFKGPSLDPQRAPVKVKKAYPTVNPWFYWCPKEESNPRLRITNAILTVVLKELHSTSNVKWSCIVMKIKKNFSAKNKVCHICWSIKFLFLSHRGHQKHFRVELGKCLEEIHFHKLYWCHVEWSPKSWSVRFKNLCRWRPPISCGLRCALSRRLGWKGALLGRVRDSLRTLQCGKRWECWTMITAPDSCIVGLPKLLNRGMTHLENGQSFRILFPDIRSHRTVQLLQWAAVHFYSAI